jgi:hypothetical protein
VSINKAGVLVQKQFDRDLYDRWDSKGKNKISNIVKRNTSLKVIDPISKTDVDLLVYDEGEYKFNIEVEIKLVWGTKDFPYESVQFPARKEKFCHKEKPTLFVMFNKDTSSYLCVTSKDLLESPTKIVSNKYVRYGEYFFQVPLDKVVFNDITKAIKRLGVKV